MIGQNGWEYDSDYISLPLPPNPMAFGEPDWGTVSVNLPDVEAWEQPVYEERLPEPGGWNYVGDRSLYEEPPGSYEAPDILTAARTSWADVLRGSYDPTPEESANADRAVAEIVAAREAGGDWQGIMRGWGTSLSDVLRSALPAVVNRILGTTPSGGVAVRRGPVQAGLGISPMWLIVGGIVVLVAFSGFGARRASYGRAPARRRAPRQRRQFAGRSRRR